jgi:hypothetical protein
MGREFELMQKGDKLLSRAGYDIFGFGSKPRERLPGRTRRAAAKARQERVEHELARERQAVADRIAAADREAVPPWRRKREANERRAKQ